MEKRVGRGLERQMAELVENDVRGGGITEKEGMSYGGRIDLVVVC
jgi:hypothetical protein